MKFLSLEGLDFVINKIKEMINVSENKALENSKKYTDDKVLEINNAIYTLESFDITATSEELNYCDGVTSNIQTQLNGKAESSHTHNYLPLTGGTISGALALSGSHAMMARHVDGSTDGYIGELYLNYNNPNADIYLGTNGRITNNGASYIGTASNATNSDTLDGFHASSFCKTAFASTTNMNELINSGAYRINASNTNAPAGVDYGQIFVVHGGGDTIAQLAFDYSSGRCWMRTGNPPDAGGTGAWTEWRSVYTSQNITYGTAALTPGSSSLATGSFYYQYE